MRPGLWYHLQYEEIRRCHIDGGGGAWRKILYSRAYGARDYVWYNLRATRPDPNSAEAEETWTWAVMSYEQGT